MNDTKKPGVYSEQRIRAAEDPWAKLLALLARHEPERNQKLRAVVREQLAPLAEHVDVAQVEQPLVARL